jgi:hypothetical protein
MLVLVHGPGPCYPVIGVSFVPAALVDGQN